MAVTCQLLNTDDQQVLTLSGDLIFATAEKARQNIESLLTGLQGSVILDLSAISRVDSSALALWLNSLRYARQADIQLSLTNCPAELQQMADLVGLSATEGWNVCKTA